LSWWEALTSAFSGFGSLDDYGLIYAAWGGTIAAGIILWLDRRPAMLLGVSAWLLWIGGRGLAVGVSGGYVDALLFSLLLLVGALPGVWLAVRDVRVARGRRRLAIGALAAATFGALQFDILVAPALALVALVVDRPPAAAPSVPAPQPNAA
jgi:hypothetical protein